MAVTRTLRLTRQHLERFADASGDRNPLHVDEAFARATPYGRCICHGALVTIAALGVADEQTLRDLRALDVQFRQPVFPGEAYTIAVVRSEPEKTRIQVLGQGKTALTVTVTRDPSGTPLPDAAEQESAPSPGPPLEHTLGKLADGGVSLSERYACRVDALSKLAADLGAGHVPDGILVWLAGASYTVGMLVPGRDALFVGARISRAPATSSGRLTASVGAVDERTGLVVLDAALDQGPASAQMALQTFLRPPVPAPSRSSVGDHLAPSTELAGRNILVVGASRGLGAALAGVFATQGATVWAGFSRSGPHAERLRAEFGRDRVKLLQFDAEDAADTRRALETLRATSGTLDGIALCAAPPLYEAALHPDASRGLLRFLESSLAMTLVPLAEFLQLLAPDGWVVVLSSSALDDPPEGWPHYVVAKAALEGAAGYCARHTGARVIVVRAPKMWTDSTNTPLGRIGAAAKEEVAAAIALWTMSEGPEPPGAALLTPDELMEKMLERRRGIAS